MTDEDQIRELHRSYPLCFDGHDADGFAELFTEDAILSPRPGVAFEGRENLRAMVAASTWTGKHTPGKAEIKLEGDRATGTNAFHVVNSEGVERDGHYEDEYVRTPQGWRFARRTIC